LRHPTLRDRVSTIHTYDIRQSQEDKATVPIFYEPRQVRLHLSAEDIDASLKDITDVSKRQRTRTSSGASRAGRR
jgi:type I site-specific restriction-modification system R (restriction) subunit